MCIVPLFGVRADSHIANTRVVQKEGMSYNKESSCSLEPVSAGGGCEASLMDTITFRKCGSSYRWITRCQLNDWRKGEGVMPGHTALSDLTAS